MFIKSGGFPLLKLNISKNEFLPGFVLNQLLYGARGLVQTSFANHTSDIRRLSWRHVESVRDRTERMDLYLPSVDDCIMGHTLFPYFAWCLTKSQTERLYAQYASTIETHDFERTRGAYRGNIPVTYRKTRRGLTWCRQCVKDEITGNDVRPFPIWHRLHFAPNIFVCHVHQIPLSTFCDECIDMTRTDPRSWIPALECLCRKDLKACAQMSMKLCEALSEITYKANEILEGKTSKNFTPTAIKEAIKKRLATSTSGRMMTFAILRAVNQNMGEEAAELLDFTEHTVFSFINGDKAPEGKNPIHALVFGYAIFKGFDALVETINGSTRWIPNGVLQVKTEMSVCKNLSYSWKTKAGFRALVASMTIQEREALHKKARTWLLRILKIYPDRTRTELWACYQTRHYEFNYLVWVDTDWYKAQISTKSAKRSRAALLSSLSAIPEISVKMINERRMVAINDEPLKAITKSYLMRPLDGTSISSIERRYPHIRKALEKCRDNSRTWQLRAAQTISQMISDVEPNHRYANLNWYMDVDSKEFSSRLGRAKQWLLRHKDQH